MSKMSNIIKKGKLFSIILATVLLAGVIIGICFKFNKAPEMKNVNTLTVSVNKDADFKNADAIKAECEKVFDKENLTIIYQTVGEMDGDSVEYFYAFDENSKLDEAKTALKSLFADKTAEGKDWAGSFIDVSTAKEEVASNMAKGYALRGGIACVIIAVLAIGYVTLRFKGNAGWLVGIAFALTACLTTSLTVLCRIPVTTSIAYVIILSGILAMIMTLFTLNNIRENDAESTEEGVANSVALKETLLLASVTTIALIVLIVAGIIANASLIWFALASIVGVISAVAIALVFAPFIYLPLMKKADAKKASKEKRYVGAKAKDEE